MTRLWFAILISLTLGTSALGLDRAAAEPPAHGGGGGGSSQGSGNRFALFFNRGESDEDGHDDEEEEDDPRAFNMPALVVPLSSHGRLTGFAYVQVRVRAADGENVWDMQENLHFALDALVRAGYREPLSTENGETLDTDHARDVWREVLQEIYGANSIDRIEIRASDTRLLRR